jgi:exopolysaccharide biosynthesis polyprenyl glycosylphosphotransferase
VEEYMQGDDGQQATSTQNGAEPISAAAIATQGRIVQDDAARATSASPLHGAPPRQRGIAPLRSESPEPRNSLEAEPARLGSARYGYTFRRALLIADVLGLVAAIVAADVVLASTGRGGLALEPLLATIGFAPVWLFLALAVGLYHLPDRRVDHTFADEFAPVFLVTTVWSWLDVIATALILNETTELLGPCILWMAAIVVVLTFRAIARRIARGRAWYRRRVLLIGDRRGTDGVLERVLRHPEWGLEVVSRLRVEAGHLDLDRLDGVRTECSERIEAPDDQSFADRIAAVTSGLAVDRVILAGASASLSERTELARRLTECGHCVDYVYGEPEALYATAVLHHLEGLPVLSVQPTRLSRGSAAVKRGLDLAIGSAGLVLLSPLFAIVAIGIKLDSRGPVFFRQARVGRDGTGFQSLKFRTMVDGADAMRDELRERSIHSNGHGLLKLRDDPRITRLGAKLRRWSIDELPQLWNVLRGDMSLVGPRPLPLDEAGLVRGHLEIRTRVRPGITGTWQTHGRSDIPLEDMLKLDYTYVAGWSLREDLRLLLRTVATVARGRGAY